MNILGITLARGGSKSVYKKNIAKINRKPLIYYTIKEALKSTFLTEYIISTDDKQIANISKKFGGYVPFLRPKYLSSDQTSSVKALQHAVKFMEAKNKLKYDYIIELMCTNPLKNVVDIDSVIKKLIKSNADSVIAVHKLEDHHPARIKKIKNDYIIDFCLKEKLESRRQDLFPHAYIRSGSIYGLSRKELMIKNRRYGSKNSRPYILPTSRAINIDNKLDFLVAEQMIKNNEKKI